MRFRWPVNARLTLAMGMVALLGIGVAAQLPPGIGLGWQGEFDHSSKQLLQLAEATPADKFSWRPAPGVRSVSEVYMHVALANYELLGQAGVQHTDFMKLGKDPEKGLTAKADVIKFLKESFAAVNSGYAKADKSAKVKFFGRETTTDGVMLRILVHNHEHMGQSIAYARMIGVVPPWSQPGGSGAK